MFEIIGHVSTANCIYTPVSSFDAFSFERLICILLFFCDLNICFFS